MTDERRLAVLRAIVEDYVATSEPVGSKALADRRTLGVSSATIRNDMAQLEVDGLIAQPHTSAGRIPTDKGYRLFVDQLDTIKPLTIAERRAIAAVMGRTIDFDDALDRAVRALASLTNQVAMVRYPALSSARLQHCELVTIATTRLLLVLITDNGRVEQRVIPSHADITDDDVHTLRDRINNAVVGLNITEVTSALDRLSQQPSDNGALTHSVIDTIRDALSVHREERLVVAGTANLARAGYDIEELQDALAAIEEHVVLLQLLTDMADDKEHGVSVRIGGEHSLHGLSSTSVISSEYSPTDPSAKLGVLGPTRMDYPTTMAAVRAVARYMTRVISDGERNDTKDLLSDSSTTEGKNSR